MTKQVKLGILFVSFSILLCLLQISYIDKINFHLDIDNFIVALEGETIQLPYNTHSWECENTNIISIASESDYNKILNCTSPGLGTLKHTGTNRNIPVLVKDKLSKRDIGIEENIFVNLTETNEFSISVPTKFDRVEIKPGSSIVQKDSSSLDISSTDQHTLTFEVSDKGQHQIEFTFYQTGFNNVYETLHTINISADYLVNDIKVVDSVELFVGESMNVDIELLPDLVDPSNTPIEVTSKDSSICDVTVCNDVKGTKSLILSAKNHGTTTISVVAGDIHKEVKVNVKRDIPSDTKVNEDIPNRKSSSPTASVKSITIPAGAYGILDIPSCNIRLPVYSMFDSIRPVDRPNMAGASYFHGGKLVIGDHNYQGFDRIKKLQPGDTFNFYTNKGTVVLEVMRSYTGFNEGSHLSDANHKQLSGRWDSDTYVMYTCNDSKAYSVWIVESQRISGPDVNYG